MIEWGPEVEKLEWEVENAWKEVEDLHTKMRDQTSEAVKPLVVKRKDLEQQVAALKQEEAAKLRQFYGQSLPTEENCGSYYYLGGEAHGSAINGIAVFIQELGGRPTFHSIDGDRILNVDDPEVAITYCEELAILPKQYVERLKQAFTPRETREVAEEIRIWLKSYSIEPLGNEV